MADVRLAQVDEHPFGISWVIDEAGSRASHALKVEGQVYVIDPVEHEAALERIEVLGPVAAVVQLLDRHNRDCAAIARKLGVPHLRMPEAIPNTPLETIRVVDLRRWREVAYLDSFRSGIATEWSRYPRRTWLILNQEQLADWGTNKRASFLSTLRQEFRWQETFAIDASARDLDVLVYLRD